MEKLQLSVRALVEFTLHGEDISSSGSLRDLQEGMFGHKGRQAALGEDWQAEVPVSLEIPLEEDELTLSIAGRMDALCDGEIPEVEEIKLWQGERPPESPVPAHTVQAQVYAAMLCAERGCGMVRIRVAYVTREGKLQALFPSEHTAEELRSVLNSLLENYLRRLRLMRAHQRVRDASLRALRFPFPDYRPGQREMAVQVYTAITRRKRLLASMPTGTGKSAAALFPALKALGGGYTDQIWYLTARTTQRQGPQDTLVRLREQPVCLWVLTLDAKERQCPQKTRCHPDFCPRAKGHFLRDSAAIEEMLREEDWSPEAVRRMADRHELCPFEFSLALAELADLTICDYNYALDPAVHIQRIFDRPQSVTLLVDEAHHLAERVREMLSGEVDGQTVRRVRTATGRHGGRRSPLYKALTRVLRELEDLPAEEGVREGVLEKTPPGLVEACAILTDELMDGLEDIDWGEEAETASDLFLQLLGFARAARRTDAPMACLWQGIRQRRVALRAMDIADYFRQTTARMCGTVCFSATLSPLAEMKQLLGFDEEDACFEAPSPFPPENLLLVRQQVNTRYAYREATAREVAELIETAAGAKPGRYIAFFPSFAYMEAVSSLIGMVHRCQSRTMTEEERRAFLAPYREDGPPCLSLCVLGGIFAEGIDLPGAALNGVMVVGIGLPQVCLELETQRAWLDARGRDGFLYAYRLPGMQKVAQAVGRVVRTETDRGIALLIDDRYQRTDTLRLCPSHWQWRDGDLPALLRAFWEEK